jgi:hypothetical protein
MAQVTLTEFLLARIAEDDAMARAATTGPWRYNPGKEWHTDPRTLEQARTGMMTFDGEEFVAAGPDDGDNSTTVGVAATGPADNLQSMDDAAFIAHHDPIRVLAECEAKRAIVFMSEHGCGDDYERVQRALALPYADHPDYLLKWKP